MLDPKPDALDAAAAARCEATEVDLYCLYCSAAALFLARSWDSPSLSGEADTGSTIDRRDLVQALRVARLAAIVRNIDDRSGNF